jgi:hypothetical protein
VVKGRAYSYAPAPGGGYRYLALSYSTVGPSSLFSTVEDLALWDANFYTAEVGGSSAVARLQAKGRLNSGDETAYASGLIVDEYRGLTTVWHSGADAGYRTNMLRFPDERFTVIILANAAEIDPGALSYRIADIYLDGRFKAPSTGTPMKTTYSTTEVALAPEQIEPFLGDFEWTPGFVISFTSEGGGLVSQVKGQGKVPLTASSPNTFFSKAVEAEFVFSDAGADGKVPAATLRQHGQELPLKRVDIPPLPVDQLGRRTGTFYSEDLGVAYVVFEKEGGLLLRHPRAEAPLMQVGPDAFAAGGSLGVLRFTCGGNDPCAGFSLDSGLVRNLRFRRMELTAAE